MFNILGGLIGNVAPAIGKAITGDLGGAIGEGLKAFGLDVTGDKKKDISALEAAIKVATPEQLAELKRIDTEFETKMKDLDVDLERIAAQDRSSARIMRIETNSIVGDVIGCGIVIGFFGVLYFIFKNPDVVNRALDIMLGALGTMATAVVTFYFGSSAGSRNKDKLKGS